MRGGYIVFDTADASGGAGSGAGAGAAGAGAGTASAARPDLIVAGTGSEVSIAIDGAKKLAAGGKRVLVASLPCLEVFEAQPAEYKKSVLIEGVPVLTIEALTTKGWERYGHAAIGMHTFGHSGPYLEVYKKFGITADAVAEKGGRMIEYFASHAVSTLPLHMPAF